MIPFPQELRPPLPTVVGNVDYLTLRQRWEQIETLLRDSGAERDLVQRGGAATKVFLTAAGSAAPPRFASGGRTKKAVLRCACHRCPKSSPNGTK
jgi:hypothetical protein